MERSPLGRLPRELRDLIYEYAVVHEDGVKITFTGHGEADDVVKVMTPNGSSQDATLALAMACRQLHEETIELYYKRNHFYFPCDYWGPRQLKNFLGAIKDDRRKLLTQVIFKAPTVNLNNMSYFRFRGLDLMLRLKRVTSEIVESADGIFLCPVSVCGRFALGSGRNEYFDLVLDMNRVQGSMEENIKKLEAQHQGSTDIPSEGCRRFQALQDRMKMFVLKFDDDYGRDYIHLYDSKSRRRIREVVRA